MMESEGSWELFDLDADLHVSISEDAKSYLRQFGLEEYDFENYQPTNDPGKYFDDVPQDQNPEALFDDLTRESIRRNAGKPTSWNTRSSLIREVYGGQRAGQTTTNPKKYQSGSINVDKPSNIPLSNLEKENNNYITESPKSAGKRVSFTENVIQSNENDLEQEQNHLKHSRTVANLFGRPKTKNKSKNSGKSEESSNQMQHESRDKTKNNKDNKKMHRSSKEEITTSHSKKGKKFRFPAFDMKRSKRSSTFQRSNEIEDSEESKHIHLDISTPSSSSSSLHANHCGSDNNSQHQVEVQDASSPSNTPDKGSGLDFDSIDSRQFARNSRVSHHGKTVSPTLNISESLNNIVVVPSSSNAKTEVVTFGRQQIEKTEINISQSSKDSDILIGNKLAPALIAAVNGDLQTLIEATHHSKDDDMVRTVDERGNTIIHASAAAGQLHCVEYISHQFPSLQLVENRSNLTSAALAIKHGQIEVLDWMLEHIDLSHELYPPSPKRQCLLHYAAKNGQDGCLRLLLAKVRDFPQPTEFSDHHGNTPAHMAAKYGHISCLQSLVEYGFDVCSVNQYGHTPSYYADFNNHRHSAAYLMVVETCSQLARQNVTQSAQLDWLIDRTESLTSFTNEAQQLSNTIAHEAASDTEMAHCLIQALDDALVFVSDLTKQLKDLNEANKSAEGGNYITKQILGQNELTDNMVRISELRQNLEKMGDTFQPQTSRKQILKVKELERRWHKLKENKDFINRDLEPQVQQLLRKRFSDANQRLLVCRTSQNNNSNTLNKPKPLPPAPILQSEKWEKYSPRNRGNVIPSVPFQSSPREGRQEEWRVTPPSDISELRLSDLDPTNTESAGSARYVGAKERETIIAVCISDQNSVKSEEASNASSRREKKSLRDRSIENLDQYSGDIASKYKPNNSVMESPPTDYQSPKSPSEKGTEKLEQGNTALKNSGLFYMDDTSPPASTQSSISYDSSHLKFSKFSAFNPVSNRIQKRGIDVSGTDNYIENTKLDNTKDTVHLHHSVVADDINITNYNSLIGTTNKEEKHSPVSFESDDNSTTTDDRSDLQLTVENLNKHNENEAISQVKEIVSKLEKRKSDVSQKLFRLPSEKDESRFGNTPKSNIGLSSSSAAGDTTLTREQPKQLVKVLPMNKRLHYHEDSASEDLSEDLSDLDLGPELHGDDLMLGPYGFLDDEMELGEECDDEIFTQDDLLALSSGGRLPLSMQFETSLSTIEEVSVVSESLQAEVETDTENKAEHSKADLEANSDSEATVTSDTECQEAILKHETYGELAGVSDDGSRPGLVKTERPWYEMSDEDEASTSTALQIPRHQLKEHFTIF